MFLFLVAIFRAAASAFFWFQAGFGLPHYPACLAHRFHVRPWTFSLWIGVAVLDFGPTATLFLPPFAHNRLFLSLQNEAVSHAIQFAALGQASARRRSCLLAWVNAFYSYFESFLSFLVFGLFEVSHILLVLVESIFNSAFSSCLGVQVSYTTGSFFISRVVRFLQPVFFKFFPILSLAAPRHGFLSCLGWALPTVFFICRASEICFNALHICRCRHFLSLRSSLFNARFYPHYSECPAISPTLLYLSIKPSLNSLSFLTGVPL